MEVWQHLLISLTSELPQKPMKQQIMLETESSGQITMNQAIILQDLGREEAGDDHICMKEGKLLLKGVIHGIQLSKMEIREIAVAFLQSLPHSFRPLLAKELQEFCSMERYCIFVSINVVC